MFLPLPATLLKRLLIQRGAGWAVPWTSLVPDPDVLVDELARLRELGGDRFQRLDLQEEGNTQQLPRFLRQPKNCGYRSAMMFILLYFRSLGFSYRARPRKYLVCLSVRGQ